MNDTVAVALITSLSTLTAAAVTGAVSARVTGRQLRHQNALAREQRAEQRVLAQRELCREACERFLSQADAAYRVLDAGWNAARGGPPTSEAPDEAARFAARRALDEACIRLQLAGPDDLAEQGASVVASIADEFRLLADTATDTDAHADRDADTDAPSARARAVRTRTTLTAAFTHTARRALGPEDAGMPTTAGEHSP